jgi:hypothetical protein
MSRIRSIKPEFWRDQDLSIVSAEAALLAIGLLNHADDEGFFNANPRLIQADVFPLRELSGSPTELLLELSNIGYLRLFFGSDGKQYGAITNFSKHQVINKPSSSRIKDLEALRDDYGSGVVVLPIGMEQGTGKGKEKEDNATPRFSALDALKDAGATESLARDWLKARAKKRLADTETAITEFMQEVGKSKQDINDILRVCCKRGWGGFEANWLNNSRNSSQRSDEYNPLMDGAI